MIPTTTQLFQQSYHLGLGWGLAEALWGTVKGWFAGMRLYVDVLPKDRAAASASAVVGDAEGKTAQQGQSRGEDEAVYDGPEIDHRTQDESAIIDIEEDGNDDDSDASAEDEEDLATKIAILERLRGRRGSSFPKSASPIGVYAQESSPPPSSGEGGGYPPFPPVVSQHHHRLFPLIVFGVIAAHVAVSLVWSLGVRKAGIGAVTWGSLIVSLGAFFAGLGA
ncbi:hypothetical protein QFC21_002690 [Naganishia friedmannii]|uniref:Uncharacterized protein n=1 Tax=Naganishia friedmannii TaxID=89922 RepID=A0ACC2VV99_9TREE|nr:hypothetical protein QFC21_002690 [Naganishia friedmannii]